MRRRPARAVALPLAEPRLAARWHALLLALLLSFCWQSLVVQTHQHLDPVRLAGLTSAVSENLKTPGKQDPGDIPANCPICREIASAGAYLLPTPVALTAPVAASFHFTPASLDALTLLPPARGWQSRAPPLRFQA